MPPTAIPDRLRNPGKTNPKCESGKIAANPTMQSTTRCGTDKAPEIADHAANREIDPERCGDAVENNRAERPLISRVGDSTNMKGRTNFAQPIRRLPSRSPSAPALLILAAANAASATGGVIIDSMPK